MRFNVNAPNQPPHPNLPPNWAPQGNPFGPPMPYPYRQAMNQQRTPQDERNIALARKRYTRVAASLLVMIVVWYLLTALLSNIFSTAIHSGTSAGYAMMYLVSDVPLYGVAIPLAIWNMSGIKPVKTRRFGLSAKQYIVFLVMTFAVMYVGNIIGSVFMGLFAPNTINPITQLMGHSPVVDIVFAVILGPIVEEWLFRKQIISRLRLFGEKTAVIFSAFVFALFHANIYQFFYAFGIGIMFGYIYMRTSSLWTTITMHMIINLNGAVIAPALVNAVGGQEELVYSAQNGVVSVAALYGLVMMAVAIVGVVFFVRNIHRTEFYHTPCQLPKGTAGKVAYGNPASIAFMVLCGLLMLWQMVA